MTDSVRQYTSGEAMDEEVREAESRWAERHRGTRSAEDALVNKRAQTVVQATFQPGGRLVIYVEVYGRHPRTKMTVYNRYQRIPDQGYVRVYTRTV